MRLARVIIGSVVVAASLAGVQQTFAGPSAPAGLEFFLQFPGGATTATVTNGQLLHLQLWASISGSTNNGFYTLGGSFISNPSAVNQGNFSNAANVPSFSNIGSQVGTPSDIDGDGDTDWGSSDPFATSAFFYARSGQPTDPVQLPVLGDSAELGTIDFTVTSILPGQSINLTFVGRDRPTAADQIWQQNGQPQSEDVGGVFFSGPAVVLTGAVPEPASLALLTLGAAGLLARRKR